MTALANKVQTTPVKTKGDGQATFTAWSDSDIRKVSELGKGQSMVVDIVFPIHATRDYGKVKGAYNAYASAFHLCRKALKQHNRTDVSTFYAFKVKSVQDGVTVTVIGK